MNEQNTCIIIGGPTAVGKTDVAIEVAKYFGTEIISADSRQCYQELNIGVARPSPHQLKLIPHHWIANYSISDDVNAAVFERDALQLVSSLFKKNRIVVMVGGTGLYIRAFTDGLNQIPPADAVIRKKWDTVFNDEGIGGLQRNIKKYDPLFFQQGEIHNPRRVQRALEVFEQTGKSILSFHLNPVAKRSFKVIKVALELQREVLYKRINARVDLMMENNLLNEVKSLLPFSTLNALQTVGYKELLNFLGGNISLEEAVLQIKQHTRRYAKRQITWFKGDKDWHWCAPDKEAVIACCEKLIP